MRITLFTSNQPRHIALARTLSKVCDELFVLQETKTSFAGKRDAIHAASPSMDAYFGHVASAERASFPPNMYLPVNTRSMALFMGDLSFFPLETFGEALNADLFVVFGASYIRGPLADFLVERRCVNIHMGVSPYYRGSACNFWAMYDRRPEMVGATIHLLSRGLDSGPILFHAMPRVDTVDGFVLGMRAVRAAHDGLAARIADGSLLEIEPVSQDRGLELRYTRSREFTDEVARSYLQEQMLPDDIFTSLSRRREALALKDPVVV